MDTINNTELFSTGVTICNMNLAMKSVVQEYPTDSIEYSIVQDICSMHTRGPGTSRIDNWREFVGVMRNVNRSFLIFHFTAPEDDAPVSVF